jgi:hypothetical protein
MVPEIAPANMRTLLCIISFITAAGCSRAPIAPAPTNDAGKKAVVTLSAGEAVQVRQAQANPRTLLIANLDGQLQAVQLEAGGDTPRSLYLIDADKAEFTVTSVAARTLIIDQDGDGLPDLKVEGKKKYKRGKIEWIELPETSEAQKP